MVIVMKIGENLAAIICEWNLDFKFINDRSRLFKGEKNENIFAVILACSLIGGKESKEGLTFWEPQNAIARSLAMFPDGSILVFADYYMEAWMYAVILDGANLGSIALIENGKITGEIAKNIEEFAKLYIENPTIVCLPGCLPSI